MPKTRLGKLLYISQYENIILGIAFLSATQLDDIKRKIAPARFPLFFFYIFWVPINRILIKPKARQLEKCHQLTSFTTLYG